MDLSEKTDFTRARESSYFVMILRYPNKLKTLKLLDFFSSFRAEITKQAGTIELARKITDKCP
jgi:hypothetical protein